MSQKILVTGCTGGLGLAMVHSFIESGATVAGLGRNQSKLAELRETYPSPHRFDAVDVSDDQAVRAYAEKVLTDWGSPDLLINNAAIINRNAPLWEIPDDEIDQLLRINLKGVASTMRYLLPAMNDAQHGVVVNLSSGWGRSTAPNVAPYCMSKWGIEGLSRAVSQEVADGVAVVALNPGIIDTPMLRACFGEGAAGHQSPESWAKRAVPMILKLRAQDNGASLSVG
ncbi:oxidoreductase [Coraliomargarita sinensis]|uniref:Oxidoreductase n=1 Tax=Coraliomargarita sinensis TaxID=2174842 RepID=A0A317ZJ19_9BACT|nr:SDR family oxidoreductase [Coraliomargarita sinensis]PXA05540.1 oxidoreductase [Coraliomargarita sinensis]